MILSKDMKLRCENLVKRYGNFTALNNINLSLESGKIVGLLGPNGSGKTTLIKKLLSEAISLGIVKE